MFCQFALSGNAKLNRRLVLLLLCGMVHSGVAFAGDTIVHDILDSTAFNVAMFAVGWAATRRMKGTELLFGLHRFKALLITPSDPFLCDDPAPRSSADAASAARPAAGALGAAAGGDRPREAPLLSPGDEDASSLLAGMSSLLARRVAPASDAELPPWRRSCFHSKGALHMQLSEYLDHIHWFSECSSPCIVLAMCYLDRVLARHAKLELTAETCHGLVLTSLVMALKFHDEDFVPYPNNFYAEIGTVFVQDLNVMEKEFCKLLDWRFYVDTEEYERYRSDILAATVVSAAAGQARR